MKRNVLRTILPILLFIAVAIGRANAQVGFQATLDTPPSFVSPWQEPKDQFSAAIYPRTFAYLSPRLKLMPRATYSSFDQDYIRFETDYYNRGRTSKALIPVAVDAKQYSAYRRENSVEDMFSETNSRSLARSGQGGGRGGWG